jgi:hypothetical protein
VTKTNSTSDKIRAQIDKSAAELNSTAPVKRLPEGEPPEGVSGLVADYPGLAIAAGLGIGLLAGALLPRSAGRKLARGAIFLASAGGELGLAFGKQALQAADQATRDGREKLSETASGVASSVSDRAAALGHKAAEAGRSAGTGAQRLAGDASDRARGVGAGIAKLATDAVARIKT